MCFEMLLEYYANVGGSLIGGFHLIQLLLIKLYRHVVVYTTF